MQLERQLDRARSTDLIKRVQTAIGAAGAEAARQRLRRAPKQRTGLHVGGIAEVRVIENIEELSSETKPHLLSDVKLALQRHVRLPGSEPAQHVAPEIPLLAGGRRGKGRFIEDFAAGKLLTVEH